MTLNLEKPLEANLGVCTTPKQVDGGPYFYFMFLENTLRIFYIWLFSESIRHSLNQRHGKPITENETKDVLV